MGRFWQGLFGKKFVGYVLVFLHVVASPLAKVYVPFELPGEYGRFHLDAQLVEHVLGVLADGQSIAILCFLYGFPCNCIWRRKRDLKWKTSMKFNLTVENRYGL